MLFKIAWRNIWRNKRRSLITLASVAFALFFAIVMRSMQLGTYDKAYSSVINATTGFMQWQAKGYWDKQTLERSFIPDSLERKKMLSDPGLKALLPRLESFALLASDQSETKPGFLKGIDAEMESQYFNLNEKLLRGTLPQKGEQGVCLASKLAESLKLDVGDTLIIVGQGYHGISANGKYPVLGVADLKNPVANKSTVYLDLGELQYLTGAYDRVSAEVLVPKDPEDLEALQSRLISDIDTSSTTLLTWRQMLPELIEAMEADSAGGLAILFILYLVIGFGVFGTILMLTAERKPEFGILLSIGMNRGRLALSTFLETTFLNLLGIITGSLLALPIALYYHYNPIELSGDMDAMMEDYGMEPLLPFSIDPDIWFTHGGIVLCISVLVSLYAIVSIYRLNPVKAMRR
tara:strand:+ start:51 stop:1271 length:1221 start_codon:yes stop_codon:yes gene_type:complete